jgi:NAD(P)H-dependent FMN reductase
MSKNIQIIVGSTRQNRLGAQVAEWVKSHAEKHKDLNIEVVDLLAEDLPFFNAPVSPMYAPDSSPAAQAWAETIDRGDGFIFVTPEYNRSIPASLKNALDFLVAQWNEKPAAVVSYGWIDGGASASKHLHDILAWLKVSTSESSVALKLSPEIMGEDGKVKDIDRAFRDHVAVLESALDELAAHETIAQPVS